MRIAAAGLGWDVEPVAGAVAWSHGGALEGTAAAWPYHGADGLAMAFVFNTLPEDFGPFFLEAGTALRAVADAVTTRPAHDLFTDAGIATPPA